MFLWRNKKNTMYYVGTLSYLSLNEQLHLIPIDVCKICLISGKISNVDPDQMPHPADSNLGLQRPVCLSIWGEYSKLFGCFV